MKTAMPARVKLRERDFEILAALEKWGVLGLAQLDGLAFKKEAPAEARIRLFFNEMDRRMYALAAYKRLRDLEAGGYLRGHFYLNHPKVFTLAERGHRALCERSRAVVPGFKRGISEALLTHELAVNGVGLTLAETLGLRVRSEFERATSRAQKQGRKSPARYVIPDLWIVPRSPAERPRAVEVELTQKSEERYKQLWADYSLRLGHETRLLYLTGWPAGVDALLRLTEKQGSDGGGWRVFVADLKEFRETGGRCAFVNRSEYDPRRLRLAPPSPPSAAAVAAAAEAR